MHLKFCINFFLVRAFSCYRLHNFHLISSEVDESRIEKMQSKGGSKHNVEPEWSKEPKQTYSPLLLHTSLRPNVPLRFTHDIIVSYLRVKISSALSLKEIIRPNFSIRKILIFFLNWIYYSFKQQLLCILNVGRANVKKHSESASFKRRIYNAYLWNCNKFQDSFGQTRSKKKPQYHRFLIQYRWAVLRIYVRANAIISRTDHPVKSWFAVAQKHREVIRAIGQLNSIVTTTELLTRETRNVHVATGHKIRLVESPNLYYARFRDR